MTAAYPLSWPPGWPRVAPEKQLYVGSKFGPHLTLARARDRLFNELRLLGVRKAVILSSDLRLRLDGLPRSSQPQPHDPGAAIYFELDGKPMVMACDRWARIEANINAMALAIEHMRGLERHGGGFMMKKAFTGFKALPPPTDWRRVLELGTNEGSLRLAEQAYRRLCKEASGATVELNAAIAAARSELS